MHLHLHHSNLFLCSLIVLLYVPTAHLTYNPTYPCRSNRPTQWERDPKNCSKYYFCIYGRPILMPACPPDQVWSQRGSACVWINSYWDDCEHSTTTHSTTTSQYAAQKVRIFPQTKLFATGNRTPTTTTAATTTTSTTTTAATTATSTTTTTAATTTSTTASTTIPTSTRNPNIPADSPCLTQSGIIPHSINCHWYYNCSLSSESPAWKYYEMFTVECPYPQLFDAKQLRCREFLNNNCNSRFEPVDACEYRRNQCLRSHCIPCRYSFGSCRGRPDGIYPFHENSWTPKYFTCYYERALAYDSCESPTPLFSPIENYCVSYYLVPKEKKGMRPDCRFRANGYYPDEMGRCNVYFQCNNAKLQGFHECNYGLAFNPVSNMCQSTEQVSPPCGSGSPPSCVGRQDGFYADLSGRCSYYFECKHFLFKTYHKCPRNYAFNPYQRSCVKGIESQIKPCGLQDNPCENHLSGLYAYNVSNSHYYECSQGLFIYYGICPTGQSFNISSRQCETSEVQDIICVNKADGRYKYPEAECLVFYECSQQRFLGEIKCTDQLNGTRFNSLTGTCDKPQNICPPCGYKWFNCPSYHESTTRFT